MSGTDELVDLVSRMEVALAMVAGRTKKDKLGIELQRAELHLKVATKKTAKAGGKLEFGVSIDVSSEKEWSKAHTFILALTPKAKIALGKDESEELADAIIEIASAIKQLEKTVAGNFNASEATVSIEVERSTDGKLQVVAGGGGKSVNAHTLKLTFRPSAA
ncbi:MAG TPA: trypco2 family protein [Bryobacteraceae bacterium]|nr:trypco2 family protein [Bryobacteraceae bacterium]